jgi:hypothetical protein
MNFIHDYVGDDVHDIGYIKKFLKKILLESNEGKI